MKIFEHFECSGQNLSNFLSILKRQVDSSLNFVSLFSFMKGSGQSLSNFLCQFWNGKSIPLQILYPSSVSWNMTPLYFLAQTMYTYIYIYIYIYTLFKRNPLKWKFFGLSSARVKICQIPHVSFEMTSQFLFKFCVVLHCNDR